MNQNNQQSKLLSSSVQSSVLNSSNYYGWSSSMSTQLQAKGYFRFIKYSSFGAWWNENHHKSDQEARYDRLRAYILAKPIIQQAEGVRAYGDAEREDELLGLDNQFHTDLSRWSHEKAKAQDLWLKEEEMCRGVILSAVGEVFKAKIVNMPVFEMWTTLKDGSNTKELGYVLLLFKQLFDLRINRDESLSHYLDRVILLSDRLRDAGQDYVLPEIVMCFLILCQLPDEYSMLAQSLGQAGKEVMTLDYLRGKFSVEDSRKKASKYSKSGTRRKIA